MRVNGEWLECEDGEIRPVVHGMVRLANGQWLEVAFLLDGGADRTVFSPDFFFNLLQPMEVSESEPSHLAGVGGQVNTTTIATALGFKKDDGRPATVQGTFRVFTKSESADLSVLGRDVTNNFSVVYDYPNQTVALLATPHYDEIKKAS